MNDGLENFMKEKGMDLLAILSHKRTWIDEMFHHNRAKQLAEKNSVPLIVFQLESLSNTGKSNHH